MTRIPCLSFPFLSLDSFQNILRGSSVLLGPSTTVLWRALAQSQNHIPGGGPAELTDLLEQYAQTLAQNMKLTYLNPVALVAPNLGELRLLRRGSAQQLHCQTNKIFIFTQPICSSVFPSS